MFSVGASRSPTELELAHQRFEGWLEQSLMNSRKVYHIGLHLAENSKSMMLRELSWMAYQMNYVVLVQRRHKAADGKVAYEYIAIRTAKPYKRT